MSRYLLHKNIRYVRVHKLTSDYLLSTGFSFPPDGYGAAWNPHFLTMDHRSTPQLPSGMENTMDRVFGHNNKHEYLEQGFGQLQFSFPNA